MVSEYRSGFAYPMYVWLPGLMSLRSAVIIQASVMLSIPCGK